ncbi:MAG: hypothetical protein ACRDSH_22055 [Pseudonocardiaceae bacterium]
MTETGDRRIEPEEMAALLTSGAARPLMGGYDPVPVHHDGQWWHIPTDAAPEAPYVPATAEQHQLFNDLAARLALADVAVARATEPDHLS